MPAKSTALHSQLLDGFTVKSRDDGTVHSIKSGARTVAEVCVGKKNVRLNLRSAPAKAPKGVTLGGKSKSWAGGGVIVTDANLAACRALLSGAVEVAPAPTAESSATAQRKPTAARKRVQVAGRKRSSARSAA